MQQLSLCRGCRLIWRHVNELLCLDCAKDPAKVAAEKALRATEPGR